MMEMTFHIRIVPSLEPDPTNSLSGDKQQHHTCFEGGDEGDEE